MIIIYASYRVITYHMAATLNTIIIFHYQLHYILIAPTLK
nr:MAG TPA: hypothetical protein [Caudoviricetes sp.]